MDKIEAQREEAKKAVKVLLLGAGECGKSTILKQMKIINLNGFTKAEEAEFKDLVFKNTMDCIQSLILACRDLCIPFENEGSEAKSVELMAIDSSGDIPHTLGQTIADVWADPCMTKARDREAEFHLLDSAPYFLSKVLEKFTPDFVPSIQDALRTRLTTTGIIETEFCLENKNFKMFDVGGQRGERKKWIHVFDDITAIMFIASLSEYNQVLAEDRSKNRLIESWDLFEGIINLPWFVEAAILLFLNKNDLFEEKIIKFDLGDYHEDYDGGKDYDNGLSFIKDEYFALNEDEDRTIYSHVTDATNTENIKFVWQACKHVILQKAVEEGGMI